MEILSKVFGFIVNDLGSTIVLPLIMIIVGKAFGMKWKEAFSSGGRVQGGRSCDRIYVRHDLPCG